MLGLISENPFRVAGLADAQPVSNDSEIVSESNAEALIQETKPDVCIVATRSTIKDVFAALETLSRNSVNAITIAKEAFYSWNTASAQTLALDKIFKENNVSFTGTGAQDILWGYLPASISGCSHKIGKIKGLIQFNVDDYGKALCEAHGVGLSVEAFNQTLAKSEAPSYIWNSNEWLAAMMNWKVTKMTQTLLSIVVSDKDIFSKFLNGVVNAGNARGMKALVLTECEKGIKIETEMIGTVYHGGMQDCCSWKIAGEPNTELFISRPATVEVTCASAVTD